MRLVIDLQSCQSGSRLGGIGRYSLQLAKAMARTSEHEVIFLLSGLERNRDPKLIAELRSVVPPANIVEFAAPEQLAYVRLRDSDRRMGELLRERVLCDLQPDFVHISSLFEGLADDVVMTIPGSAPYRTAVTLYDLIPLRNKEKYLTSDVSRKHYFDKLEHLQRADLLLAISEYSAAEGHEFLNEFRGKIQNIRGGIDNRFRFDPLAKKSAWLQEVTHSSEYLLYTASFDQRKNHERLIEAFALMSRRCNGRFILVIAGNGWPQVYEQLYVHAERVGLKRSQVVFTGRVTDDQLVDLYRHARLFVFPPLWEGLGLPVLEALACGTPVIGSNTTSIPEVVGNVSALFDPFDVIDMAAMMYQAAVDDKFNSELRARGLEHVSAFTWENSAKLAWEALCKIVPKHRQSPRQRLSIEQIGYELAESQPDRRITPEARHLGRVVANCIARNEFEIDRNPRLIDDVCIGWVTTWGSRCGIATYSERLIRSLGEASHMIFAAHATNTRPDASNVVRCWHQRGQETLDNLYDALSKQRLDVVHIQFNFGFFHPSPLNNLVDRLVKQGTKVVITLHSTKDPPPHIISDGLSSYLPAFSKASALVVHSLHDVVRLGELGIERNVWPIAEARRDFNLSNSQSKSRGPLVLATHGFFLPHKGIPEMIEALALMHASGVKAQLLLVNASYGDEGGVSDGLIASCRQQVDRLGLNDYVTFITDYLEDEASAELLSSADLIVFPYQETGESSSGAVRMGLSTGRFVATTPLEIFSDVQCATYRLAGTSSEQIAQSIMEFSRWLDLGDQRIEALSQAARKWCEINSPKNIAAQHRRLLNRLTQIETWGEVEVPSFDRLPIKNGILRNGVIECQQGHLGLVMHGPYLFLTPGLYRLIVRGNIANNNAENTDRHNNDQTIEHAENSAATIEVTEQNGAVRLAFADVFAGGNGNILCDELFAVKTDAFDVEVRIWSHGTAELKISSYSLLKRANDGVV